MFRIVTLNKVEGTLFSKQAIAERREMQYHLNMGITAPMSDCHLWKVTEMVGHRTPRQHQNGVGGGGFQNY